MDKLDVFDLNEKKKLPGERKELFPEGVPGVTQGIPPEYMKGNQPPPDSGADAAEVNPPAVARGNRRAIKTGAARRRKTKTRRRPSQDRRPTPKTPQSRNRNASVEASQTGAAGSRNPGHRAAGAGPRQRPAAELAPWPAQRAPPAQPWPAARRPAHSSSARSAVGAGCLRTHLANTSQAIESIARVERGRNDCP